MSCSATAPCLLAAATEQPPHCFHQEAPGGLPQSTAYTCLWQLPGSPPQTPGTQPPHTHFLTQEPCLNRTKGNPPTPDSLPAPGHASCPGSPSSSSAGLPELTPTPAGQLGDASPRQPPGCPQGRRVPSSGCSPSQCHSHKETAPAVLRELSPCHRDSTALGSPWCPGAWSSAGAGRAGEQSSRQVSG